MIDRAAVHPMADLAALYALGALTQHEARSFEEHLREGCEDCKSELESFERAVMLLGLSAAEAEPPSTARAKLMARISQAFSDGAERSLEGPDVDRFISILGSEGEWKEPQQGVLLKQLYVDRTTGIATSLVKMLAGTALPVHKHTGVEQFLVIEGDCNVAGQTLGPGDYHRAEAGSIHQTTYTVDGTMFLLIAPQRYELLDAR